MCSTSATHCLTPVPNFKNYLSLSILCFYSLCVLKLNETFQVSLLCSPFSMCCSSVATQFLTPEPNFETYLYIYYNSIYSIQRQHVKVVCNAFTAAIL